MARTADQSTFAGPRGSAKILSKRVLVNIHRATDMMCVTPRVVWQHEIPILEGIFGEGQIKPVDSQALDEGYNPKASADLMPHNKKQDQIIPPSQSVGLGYVFCTDAAAEFQRLAELYGRHPDVNEAWVENVYGRFKGGRFESVVGRAEVEDLPEPQLRDLARAHGYIPEVNKDSTDAEKKEARDKQVTLATLKHPELVKLAETLGVNLD